MNEKKTMLIVDDIGINRQMLSLFFEDDFNILEASNGLEAIDILTKKKVNVVLLDLVMPTMDGMKFLDIVHRSSKLSQIPVIVTSAEGSLTNISNSLKKGAADFITKPYDPMIVQMRVKNVMVRYENDARNAEISYQELKLKKMQKNIELDSLTGVYTNDAFINKVGQLLKENKLIKYSIVYFNIMSFKMVNELFNVEKGNRILCEVATYLKTVAGKLGVVGRLHTDHFVICVPKKDLDMDLILQELDGVIHSLAMYKNFIFYAGIYIIENRYMSVGQMIDRAYMALNTTKGKHNERYAVYDETLRTKVLEEQRIVREMEQALKSNQFVMYLQSIYDINSNYPVAAEALVRWIHPTQGLLSPDKFLPIFEKTGFIGKLDQYIWEEACKFISNQRGRGLKITPISIKLSPLNLHDEDFVKRLIPIMKRYDVYPSMLNLEISELAYIENPKNLAKLINRFHSYGFKIMMGDFGGGESINMLKDLLLDVLKVDVGRFFNDISTTRRAEIILQSIVEMAKNLDMDIIIDGVETIEQLEYLKKIGCKYIQGYLYDCPIPNADFMVKLENI